jgi:hypothetical protein
VSVGDGRNHSSEGGLKPAWVAGIFILDGSQDRQALGHAAPSVYFTLNVEPGARQ